MTPPTEKKDLLLLVADKDAELSISALLGRPQALGIRPITFDTFRHPNRDAGCYSDAHEFLRSFHGDYRYALVTFDKHGSGQDAAPNAEIESVVDTRLRQNGWPNNSATVVIDPELEIWVWSDSANVDAALGWCGHNPNLRQWLINKGYVTATNPKPQDPKMVFELALREVRRPRSASVFQELAGNVGFSRCTDLSFSKLKSILQAWFPASAPQPNM